MKKDLDWANIGFGYRPTDVRYVSMFKNGAWDEGALTKDATVTISESAGVFQYAQTCFEGLKAYTTEDGHTVTFRPDLNAERMMNSCERLRLPEGAPYRRGNADHSRQYRLGSSVWVRRQPVRASLHDGHQPRIGRFSRCGEYVPRVC